MAKGPSGSGAASTTRTEAPVNTGELSWPDPDSAAWRVRQMQRKLHHWAVDDSDRLFDDVFNLVHHPDFLTVAWERVRVPRTSAQPRTVRQPIGHLRMRIGDPVRYTTTK